MIVSCHESGRRVWLSDACGESISSDSACLVCGKVVIFPVSVRVLGSRIVREVVVSIELRSTRKLGMRDSRECSEVEAILQNQEVSSALAQGQRASFAAIIGTAKHRVFESILPPRRSWWCMSITCLRPAPCATTTEGYSCNHEHRGA